MSEVAQYRGTGKRKTSIARVILRPGDGKTWINGRTLEEYFTRPGHRSMVLAPLEVAAAAGTYDLRIRVHGGGISGQAGAVRHGVARALVETDPELRDSSQAPGLSDPRRPHRRAQEGRPAQGAQGASVLEAVGSAAVARRFFGTDGVRGVVGEGLTPDLVERLGRAATLWCGGGEVLVGRDTRTSGPALEEALTKGIVSAGGTALLAGVLPTPAVALLARDLGVVVSASHNPPEYNGVKLFAAAGRKLSDGEEEEIEALLDAPGGEAGSVERDDTAGERYLDHVVRHFGTDLSGLRIGVDCANGAMIDLAPEAFATTRRRRHRDRSLHAMADRSTSAVARPISESCKRQWREGLDLGVAFDGDGDRLLAVDERGRAARRRPDPRDPRALARRRARGRHGDDEPGLPPPDGGARHPRRHDTGGRPVRARSAAS